MSKHLVLVGGGHAHMTVMLNLADFVERGHCVTLVSPSPYHYYSGMGPGLLGGTYRPQQVRFHIRKLVEERGARFVEDRVTSIDAENRRLRMASGNVLDYDIASFNTGSGVPLQAAGAQGGEGVVPVKPIVNLLQARRQLLQKLGGKPQNLLVVGGGPAGVELAGNLWRLVNLAGGQAQITLLAGSRLLRHFPDRVRQLALTSLQERGVRVLEGGRATSVAMGKAELNDGSSLAYDLAFIAAGVKPSTIFADSGLPVGEDGGLLVNDQLQSIAYPELFGGGDCISLQGKALAKVGVYAVRQNPILHANLLAALEERPLVSFKPQPRYLLILNLGNHRGILCKGRLIWEGRLPFLFKDWIDRRFMKTFQVSGELREGNANQHL
jgi:NADH dehydrogenase FAD-containing subunit